MKLENLRKDALVEGIEPGQLVIIRFVEAIGPDACNVNYRLPSGETRERIGDRHDHRRGGVESAIRSWRHLQFKGEDCSRAGRRLHGEIGPMRPHNLA